MSDNEYDFHIQMNCVYSFVVSIIARILRNGKRFAEKTDNCPEFFHGILNRRGGAAASVGAEGDATRAVKAEIGAAEGREGAKQSVVIAQSNRFAGRVHGKLRHPDVHAAH